jgi:hypothetical protein
MEIKKQAEFLPPTFHYLLLVKFFSPKNILRAFYPREMPHTAKPNVIAPAITQEQKPSKSFFKPLI